MLSLTNLVVARRRHSTTLSRLLPKREQCYSCSMRIISRSTLQAFWVRYQDSESSLRAWFAEAREAEWMTPNDVKRDYPTASIIGNNRVVFNIRGNRYRLVVAVHYGRGVVFIRFIGTHAEYDRINAGTI